MAARIRRLGHCRHVHANFADGAATTALAEKLRQMAFVASISPYDRRRLIDLGGAEVADRIHVTARKIRP